MKKIVIIAIACFIGRRNDEKGIRIKAEPKPNVAEIIATKKARIKKIISLTICNLTFARYKNNAVSCN